MRSQKSNSAFEIHFQICCFRFLKIFCSLAPPNSAFVLDVHPIIVKIRILQDLANEMELSCVLLFHLRPPAFILLSISTPLTECLIFNFSEILFWNLCSVSVLPIGAHFC